MSSTPRLFGIGLRGWLRLGLAICALLLLIRNLTQQPLPTQTALPEREVDDIDTRPSSMFDERGDSAEPLLVNEDWYVRNMATAHGAFVIEVEAEDPNQTEQIAYALIEPIQDDYDEILVYVHQLGNDSDLPARRMQWTPQEGYVELSYEPSDSHR